MFVVGEAHRINAYREIGLLLSFVYFLVRWQANVDSLSPGDVIFAQLACPLNYVIFCLHQEQLTYLLTKIALSHFNYILLLVSKGSH